MEIEFIYASVEGGGAYSSERLRLPMRLVRFVA